MVDCHRRCFVIDVKGDRSWFLSRMENETIVIKEMPVDAIIFDNIEDCTKIKNIIEKVFPAAEVVEFETTFTEVVD